VVGVINTAFGYAVFALFIYLGLNYVWAISLATIAGILFNFKTIGAIVFESHDNKLIIKFLGVYGVVYLFNLVGLKIFNNYQVSNYLAGAILVFPAAVIGYLLNRQFVFNKSEPILVEK
jgi:putative flippase GtrA